MLPNPLQCTLYNAVCEIFRCFFYTPNFFIQYMFQHTCNNGVITVWSERNFRQPATSCRFAFPDWIFATRHFESFRRSYSAYVSHIISLSDQRSRIASFEKKPPNPIVESVPRLGLGTIKMARHCMVASELLVPSFPAATAHCDCHLFTIGPSHSPVRVPLRVPPAETGHCMVRQHMHPN